MKAVEQEATMLSFIIFQSSRPGEHVLFLRIALVSMSCLHKEAHCVYIISRSLIFVILMHAQAIKHRNNRLANPRAELTHHLKAQGSAILVHSRICGSVCGVVPCTRGYQFLNNSHNLLSLETCPHHGVLVSCN